MAAETFSTGKVILSVDLTRTEQPNTLLSMETDGRWAAEEITRWHCHLHGLCPVMMTKHHSC